jgi:hypothetical protein
VSAAGLAGFDFLAARAVEEIENAHLHMVLKRREGMRHRPWEERDRRVRAPYRLPVSTPKTHPSQIQRRMGHPQNHPQTLPSGIALTFATAGQRAPVGAPHAVVACGDFALIACAAESMRNTPHVKSTCGAPPKYSRQGVALVSRQAAAPVLRISFPVVWRPSSSRCASAACASGNTRSMRNFSQPS